MLVVVFLGDSSRRSINVNTSNPVGNNLEKVQDGSMDNGKERGEKKGRRIEKKRGRMKWEKRYNFSQSVRYLGGGEYHLGLEKGTRSATQACFIGK